MLNCNNQLDVEYNVEKKRFEIVVGEKKCLNVMSNA